MTLSTKPPLPAAGTLTAAPLPLRGGLTPPRPALAFTHAFENLDEPEVDLPYLHVHANDLHLHLVAEPVDLLRILPAQQVRAFDEPVIVVGHRRYVNETFDVMLDQLDEQSEGCDAGDIALELVAALVGHELHFLPLQQLALGVVGPTLHLRGMTRRFRHVLGPFLAQFVVQLLVVRRAKRAVYDEVGITPDRRGEMRVAFLRQTEVAEILRGVARLLHRAEHQERDRLFFGLALDPFDQLLKMVRTQVVDRRGE